MRHYSFPTAISIGAGSRWLLPGAIRNQKMVRPLVVTDQGLAGMAWLVGIMDDLKADSDAALFAGVLGNPTESQVMKGVAAYKEHKADGIVAVGGGASLDVGKAIALLAKHSPPLSQYANEQELITDVPPIIALPTTAGTGSEVGRSTVISDDLTHVKGIYASPCLLPSQVLADPELLLSLPPLITAATGLDALTHLVEAFLVPEPHPMCDGIALEGIRLVKQSLLSCFNETGDQIQVRTDMLDASMMGAVAFQKGLGVVHSCAHALSTTSDLHHGLANAIMIVPGLRFNQASAPEKFERLSQVVEQDFIEWAVELRKALQIPSGLHSVGVGHDKIQELALCAWQDPCHQTNPRSLTIEDFTQLFTKAM